MNFISLFAIMSHWKRKPLQLLLIVLGLTSSTALWTGIQAINAEAKKSYAQATSIIESESTLSIVPKVGDYFDENHFSHLRKLGWPITPIIEGNLKEISGITIVGIDPISSMGKTMLPEFSENLKLKDFLGEPFTKYSGPNTAKNLVEKHHFKNITVINNMPEGRVFMDIGKAQSLLKKKGKLSRMRLLKSYTGNLADLTNLDLILEESIQVSDLAMLTESFHLNLTAFGFLSYLVALFIVYSTIGLAFEQRKGIFRTLRGVGITAKSISVIILIETLIIAIFSGSLGMVFGYILASMLLPDVATTLSGLFGAQIGSSLSLSGLFWLRGLGAGTLGAAICVSHFLWQTFALHPLATADKTAWELNATRNIIYKIFLIGALLILVLYQIFFESGLLSAFIILGSVLIMATLALPAMLWLLLSTTKLKKFSSPISTWFWADTRQQIGPLSISLMALMIALSINIGVSGMVGSFRKTFTNWLDQRLISEMYLKVPAFADTEKILTFLSGEASAILPITKKTVRIANNVVDIIGFSPHETYSRHWPLITHQPYSWETIRTDQALLINEQLSRRLKKEIGDQLKINTMKGSFRLPVVAVYSDYGNPKGQIMLPLKTFLTYYPDIKPSQFAIRIDKHKVPVVKQKLKEKFGLSENHISNQDQLKRLSKKIFEKTFNITDSLSVLTLTVAGIALFTSLITLSDNRRGQLAPLWAIGVSRNDLIKLEMLRAFILTALTTLLAIPVGILISFILTKHVNVQAFDWQLPLFLFPKDWIKLLILSILITFLAIAIPAYRLYKTSPSNLLKVFAYDR